MFPFPFEDFTPYVFHRPFYERKGWTAKEVKDGYLIVVNALGIKPDDIEVDAYSEAISVYGKSHNEDLNRDFDISVTFNSFPSPIENVEWTTENGLLKIWVNYAKTENSVKVVRK
jgi:HSP20 family molecular chaperone IbpA